MSTFTLQIHAQKLVAAMMLFVAALLSSCSLSDKETSVRRTNDAIEAVAEAGREVADTIAALSGQTPGERQVEPVRQSTLKYLESMESLRATVRQMKEHFPALDDYVTNTFEPAAEQAARDCQDAARLLEGGQPADEQIRDAITRIGRCIDAYAEEVTNLSREYARISG